MIESPKHFKDIIISSNEKFAKEIEEVQVETKEDLEQHQTQEETKDDINDKNLQDYDNTTETEMNDDNDDPKVCYKTNTFKLDGKWEIKSIYKSTDK
ncbi:unnamed protein product [Rhizophagus irregularis]|nr:unnamed protein product [Rhizophagus irregularis]